MRIWKIVIALLLLTTIIVSIYFYSKNSLPKEELLDLSSTEGVLGLAKNSSLSDLELRLEQERARVKHNATSCDDSLPQEMFVELPKMPSDFFEYKLLFEAGLLTDFESVREPYWKQPCWLSNWKAIQNAILNPPKDCRRLDLDSEVPVGITFGGSVVIVDVKGGNEYRIPIGSKVVSKNTQSLVLNNGVIVDLSKKELMLCAFRKGAYGYGVTPSQTIVMANPGAQVVLPTHIYASALVETYQALSFSPTYRGDAGIESVYELSDGSKHVYQNITQAQQFIQVSFNPSTLVLGPSYPVWKKGWAQELRMILNISEKTPCGSKWSVGMNIGGIGGEQWERLILQYRTSLVNGGVFSIDRPFYEVFIEIDCSSSFI